MSDKILNKVNNDIFSYDTTGGVFKMSRVMPTEIHHVTAGPGTSGYMLTSTGNGWTWTDPSTLGGTTLTAGTGVSIANDTISIGQSVDISDDVTFGTVSAKNLELNNNNGIKLTIEGDSGDITCHGTLSIDTIIQKGTNGVAIENVTIDGNVISALNYKCGNRTIVDGGAGCSFTALEIKPSTSGASETLLINSNGDITCHGTLSIDTISEKNTGSGITLSSAIKMPAIPSGTNNNKLLYNSTTGEITYQTDTSSGSDLSGLTDTNLSNLQDGDILEYNSATSQWINNGDIKTLLDSTNNNFLKITTSSGPTLPEGNLLDLDFTKATISGTNVEIYGSVIGTTVGTGVAVSDTGGISTTEASYVDLNMSTGFAWTPQFTLEFYFKMPSVSTDSQQYNGLFASFNGTAGPVTFDDYLIVERKGGTNGINFSTTLTDPYVHNTLSTESTVAGFNGEWGHIVLTNDSSQPVASQKQMYVNGVLFTTGVQNNGSQVNFATGTRDHYWVGRNGYGTQYENGVENLKIFRVYNRILTAEEAATLYENRDNSVGSSDVTNYALVSNNADGSETKWLNVIPAPTTSGSTLPDGNLLDLDFRKATISGTDVEIGGTVIGTTVGSGVTVSSTDGISSTSSSYISLDTQLISWTVNFTIELYFKLVGGSYNTIIAAWNDGPNNSADPDGHVWVARRNADGPNFRTGNANGGNGGNNLHSNDNSPVAGWDGTFGHVILTHDSSLSETEQKKIYVNGQLWTGGTTDSGDAPFVPGYKDNFWIGRISSTWGNLDNGVENLRLFRVFDHVLTSADIATLYANADGTFGQDVTNYALVSNNADGTETRWEPSPGGGVSNPKVYGSIWGQADYLIELYTLWGGGNATPVSFVKNGNTGDAADAYDFVNSHPNLWINPDPNNEYYWNNGNGIGNVFQVPRDGYYYIEMWQLVNNLIWHDDTIAIIDFWIGRFRAEQYWEPGWSRYYNIPDLLASYMAGSVGSWGHMVRASCCQYCRAGDRIFGQFGGMEKTTPSNIVGAGGSSGVVQWHPTPGNYTDSRYSQFIVFSID
jgi:hypothetical protein